MEVSIYKDTMSPTERMKALVARKRIDRVPVIPMASGYAAAIAGISLREFYLEPQTAFSVQQLASDLHGYDGGLSYSIPDGAGWDFGGELVFPSLPPISLPYLVRRAVEDPEDVKTLKIPDPRTAPVASRVLAFTRMIREKGFSASIYGGSPMGIAGSIVGPEKLLRLLHKDAGLVHVALRKATDYILHTADIYIDEFGAENCSTFCTYPLEAHAVVSPRVFEEFSLPYVKEIHETLIGKGVKKWVIHLCGDHRLNLSHWRESIPLQPRTVFTVGHEMDIEHTAKFFGEEHIIGGNVSTTLLQTGSRDEVFEACRQTIVSMKDHPGGFILTPACALPPKTPFENVEAMLDAARLFGRYDD